MCRAGAAVWFDPPPLLGCISSMKPWRYEQTDSLGFLMRAAGDPAKSYITARE